MSSPRVILLATCRDQKGIVATLANFIYENGGNILHADQHRDMEAGVFFQRIEWVPTGAAGVAEREAAHLLLRTGHLSAGSGELVRARCEVRLQLAHGGIQAPHAFELDDVGPRAQATQQHDHGLAHQRMVVDHEKIHRGGRFLGLHGDGKE